MSSYNLPINVVAAHLNDWVVAPVFVVRDFEEGIGRGVRKAMGFTSPEMEEATACLFAISTVWEAGFRN